MRRVHHRLDIKRSPSKTEQYTKAWLMQTGAGGCWELSSKRQQRSRQTGGMPTQTVSDEKPPFW